MIIQKILNNNVVLTLNDKNEEIIIMGKRLMTIYIGLTDHIHNDRNGTLKRSKKKSFHWYKKVIESNGEDLA